MLNPPGEILMYDQTANLILPRELYKGRGTGGEGITNKLRLVWSVFLIFLKNLLQFFVTFSAAISCRRWEKITTPGSDPARTTSSPKRSTSPASVLPSLMKNPTVPTFILTLILWIVRSLDFYIYCRQTNIIDISTDLVDLAPFLDKIFPQILSNYQLYMWKCTINRPYRTVWVIYKYSCNK